MPELPEVETLCRQLRQVVVGKRILDIEIIDVKIGELAGLGGRSVVAVRRRGKALEMVLDSGLVMRLHLRMSGKLIWQASYQIPPPHARLVIGFDEGFLVLVDPRRFATLACHADPIPDGIPPFPLCGPDLPRIVGLAARRRIPIKAFLMDQGVLAGIGNIYACEILHSAAVHPELPTCDLSATQWQRIADAAAVILKRAIRARGTTVSDWRDLFGRKGEYQKQLRVYRCEGLPCSRCGTAIVRKSLSGRGTYYCPSCQR